MEDIKAAAGDSPKTHRDVVKVPLGDVGDVQQGTHVGVVDADEGAEALELRENKGDQLGGISSCTRGYRRGFTRLHRKPITKGLGVIRV